MIQVTIPEAEEHLVQLIEKALAGEQIIIAQDQEPIIELVALPRVQPQRRLGGARNVILAMSNEFDEPLEEFIEYMT